MMPYNCKLIVYKVRNKNATEKNEKQNKTKAIFKLKKENRTVEK